MAANRYTRFAADAWPELPLDAWKDSYATLRRYLQIVGKVRLALAPMTNHWWQTALYLTSKGLTSSPIPYRGETFDLDLDFIDHELRVITSRGELSVLALEPKPVADFYRDFMATLDALGIQVPISDVPVEMPGETTPFHEDFGHAHYDREYVHRWWRALLHTDAVLKEFRGRFTGKCSPVHFFWGSFDLCVTLFSGRLAPPRPGADLINREAYAEEVYSVGFWPGDAQTGGAAFYAYAVPEPDGFRSARVLPIGAYYSSALSEFLLPYDAVRMATSPRDVLLDFAQSTYEAAAGLGGWDRVRLERPLVTTRAVKARREVPRPRAEPPRQQP